MTQQVERLKSRLAQLPAQDRAELAEFLIGSLDPTENADVEAAWDVELARRGEEIGKGKAVGHPADAVFARLREKYS